MENLPPALDRFIRLPGCITPLDGISNIDCNVSTGTIFAVYEKTSGGLGTEADILRTGNDIVAAG